MMKYIGDKQKEKRKCFKCGIEEGTPFHRKKTAKNEFHPAVMTEHHISYNPEIIVDCCRSCHIKIHHKIRKDNSCPYTVKEIQRMTKNSIMRRKRERITFVQTIGRNVSLFEEIGYMTTTGNPHISCYFQGSNGHRLCYIGENHE